MPQAAHTASVTVSTAVGGTYTAIDGISSASHEILVALLPTTDFKDGGDEDDIYGLGSGTIEVSGQYEQGDTLGAVLLRDGAVNKTTVFVKYMPDGTTGWRSEFNVRSCKWDMTVGGTVDWTVSLKRKGAVTVI